MTNQSLTFLFLLFCVGFPLYAEDEITLFSSSLYEGNQSHSGPLGVSLSIKEPILITEVGAFESNPEAPFLIRVAVYDNSTKQLVPGTKIYEITRENARREGDYRFTSVEQITLNPGSYMLVAQGYTNDQQNGNQHCGGNGPSVDGGDLIYIEASYWDIGAIGYPTRADGKQNAYHAANIKFRGSVPSTGSGIKTSPGMRTTR
jgi:hypothetical protein